MTVTNKIKGAMNLKGVDLHQLAQGLGLTPQAVSNKFYRNSYNVADLVKIADVLGFEVYLSDGSHKIAIGLEDIQKRSAVSK